MSMSMSDEQFKEDMNSLVMDYKWRIVERLEARDTAQRGALGAAIEGAMKWEQDLKDAREALARVEAERDAMEAMVSMLEEKEWAEHASNGPVSSRLETCITTLMNELSEANERADEATVSGMAYAEQRNTAQAQLAELQSAYVTMTNQTMLVDCEHCYYLKSSEMAALDRIFNGAQAEQQEAPQREEEAQSAQAGDERAAFEHWASDGGLYPNAVERRGDQYKLAQTHSYWQAWQARASLCIKNGESKS